MTIFGFETNLGPLTIGGSKLHLTSMPMRFDGTA